MSIIGIKIGSDCSEDGSTSPGMSSGQSEPVARSREGKDRDVKTVAAHR